MTSILVSAAETGSGVPDAVQASALRRPCPPAARRWPRAPAWPAWLMRRAWRRSHCATLPAGPFTRGRNGGILRVRHHHRPGWRSRDAARHRRLEDRPDRAPTSPRCCACARGSARRWTSSSMPARRGPRRPTCAGTCSTASLGDGDRVEVLHRSRLWCGCWLAVPARAAGRHRRRRQPARGGSPPTHGWTAASAPATAPACCSVGRRRCRRWPSLPAKTLARWRTAWIAAPTRCAKRPPGTAGWTWSRHRARRGPGWSGRQSVFTFTVRDGRGRAGGGSAARALHGGGGGLPGWSAGVAGRGRVWRGCGSLSARRS